MDLYYRLLDNEFCLEYFDNFIGLSFVEKGCICDIDILKNIYLWYFFYDIYRSINFFYFVF